MECAVSLCKCVPYQRATSDHHGLLLKLTDDELEQNGARRQFRDEAMWDRHPELKPTVATCWQTVVATTVGDVKSKLGALSDELGKWGVDMFGNVKKVAFGNWEMRMG